MFVEYRSVIDCIVEFLVVESNLMNWYLILDISLLSISDQTQLVIFLEYPVPILANVHFAMLVTNSSTKTKEEKVL